MNKLHFNGSGTLVVLLVVCSSLAGNTWAAELPVPAEYPTIQSAVDAAMPGDSVRIAPGDYYEQVVLVDKTNLTLAAEPGVVLHAFPGMVPSLQQYGPGFYPVLAAYQVSGTVLSDLTFDGENLGDLYPSATRLMGSYLLRSSGTVTNCTFRRFRGLTVATPTYGTGLHVYNPGSSVVSVGVFQSTFSDNQFGITLLGDPVNNPLALRLTVTIEGNTMNGLGPAPIGNYGIWVNTGVGGQVLGNTFLNHAYSGSALSFSSAISAYDSRAQSRTPRVFLPLRPMLYVGNTFSNNGGAMVLVAADDSQVLNSNFLGNTLSGPKWGAIALSGKNILAANNNFSDVLLGIALLGDESFGVGYPAMISAVNPSLTANWFCNVPTPIQMNPLVSGLKEQGTETNYPFAPRFQSYTRPNAGESRALLRGWHGDTVTLEASTNLVDWVPVHTHLMELPLHECRDMNADGVPQQFYRARRL